MKTILFSSLGFILLTSVTHARDLTYKFGAGYRQAYTNSLVNKDTRAVTDKQMNGLEFTYGIAKDMQIGAFFGTTGNMNASLLGPKFRYNIERLFSRDETVWKHLNIFAELAFLAKLGKEIKSGITLHAPYLGFEVFPFSENNFSILTAAGASIDFGTQNRIGFTQGMFGDVGVKYYF
ncbi:MAG: hypothetical protein J0L93_06260 [Deltaproteobacteria bacterium]|nr:hypothetical protein [Deltaproteobacteria bacterium]